MSKSELEQVKRRYAELLSRLDAMETNDTAGGEAEDKARDDILEEIGKIEHWLWALEPD